MRAAIQHCYGPPESLTIAQLPRPEPGRGQLRVRVLRSTVTSADARIRGFRVDPIWRLPMRLMLGFRRPRQAVPGMEFAGVIDDIGADVQGWQLGQRVFGLVLRGANAEWLLLPQDAVMAPIPPGISDDAAAATPFGALHAWACLHQLARPQPGEHLLVLGASGALGVFAVQFAKMAGLRVTALCSPPNMDMLRALGADTVLDRTSTAIHDLPARYDILLDLFGGADPTAWRAALSPSARHVQAVFGARDLAIMAWRRITSGPALRGAIINPTPSDLQRVAALLADGAIRPVIDRLLPLEQISAAHALVDSGRKRGAVVLTL